MSTASSISSLTDSLIIDFKLDLVILFFVDYGIIDYVNVCQSPQFPVTGNYLKKHGYETGPALGKKLKSLEEQWIKNNFVIDDIAVKKSLGESNKN